MQVAVAAPRHAAMRRESKPGKSPALESQGHRSWITNPQSKIPNFGALDPRQQAALIGSKWPADIARQQEQLDILRGLLGGQ